MTRSVREEYDEYAAAGRLRVPVAAWRWAAGSGLVPSADAGPGRWSRGVVEAADAEQVRAALRGPMGAGVAADRLTEALGVPLPILRPRVTASAVGRLVKAGLLVYLGGDVEFPDVHPDQLAALGRRRDLPAVLDRHVPLGPDQAAVRLGVRRTDFTEVVRLGWLSPVGSVDVDYKRQGGVTTVPLYSAEDVALLEVVRPSVDWRAVRTVAAGRRSPLAALDPIAQGQDRAFLAEVARIARVGRAAVVNWRRRHPDFPAPVAGTDVHPQFDRRAVAAWLLAHDKIGVPTGPTVASLVLAGPKGATHRFRLDDPWLTLADDAEGEDSLSGWSTDADADVLAELAAGEFGASVRRLTPRRSEFRATGRRTSWTMTAGDEQNDVLADGMTMTGMSLEALDAVVWDGLETSHWSEPVEDVPRALRRLALAGPAATEDDCEPLYSLVTRKGCESPSAAAVALSFIVALAADPDNGARVTLTELLAAMHAPALTGEDWTGAWALLTDPDPAVRRAAIPLARGSARLLERWQTEADPAVRLPILIAIGGAAADPEAEQDDVNKAREVLDQVLGGDEPVLWVAAVYAASDHDRDLPLRQLDRLVEVFSDLAVRPRFEEAWYQTNYELPSSRENVLWWISRRLEHNFEAQLSFAVRLIEAADRTGDTPLRREALDLAWRQLVRQRSAAATLLPLAGALLDDPDGPVRLRAANILAAIGPATAPYADRLAELLDDDAADEDLDGTVGEIARWALARIGDPRALPGLIEQLRAQEEEGRGYGLAEPRRPHTAHVLIPLRANAHVLLPAMRRAIRDDGAQGGATCGFLAVLEAWGEDALPALPDLLPLLADTWTSVHVLGVLRAMGPAAASAEPALRTCQLLDHPGNHWSVTWTAACIRGDRAAALRLVGDAVMTAEVPEHGPFFSLAEFGLDAAPYADWVRSIHESSTQWWARLSTAVTLWSITGRADPAVQVLEEFVLPVADGDDSFGPFREALQGLIRIGEISPAIREALLTVRESERRLSQLDGYEAILQDEELRQLIEQALACAQASPGETC